MHGRLKFRIAVVSALTTALIAVAMPQIAQASSNQKSAVASGVLRKADYDTGVVGNTPSTASPVPDPPDDYVASDSEIAAVEEDTTPVPEDEVVDGENLGGDVSGFPSTAVEAASRLSTPCPTDTESCARTLPVGSDAASEMNMTPLVTDSQIAKSHSDFGEVDLSALSTADKAAAQTILDAQVARVESGEEKTLASSSASSETAGTAFVGDTAVDETSALEAAAAAVKPKAPKAVALPSWCQAAIGKKGYNQKWVVRRFAACRFRGWDTGHYIKSKGLWVLVGQVLDSELEYIYMRSGGRSGNTWVYQTQRRVFKTIGNAGGMVISASGSCVFPAAGCVSDSETATRAAFFKKDHFIIKTMALQYSLTQGGVFSYQGSWGYLLMPLVGRGQEYLSKSPAVRCDQALKGYATSKGCTIPGVVPVISYVGAGVPDLRNHIQDAQKSGLPGAFPRGTSLNRLYNDAKIDANRERSCPRSLPRRTLSCDEYPFATTRQGPAFAGTPASDWRTFTWCGISPQRADSGPVGFSRCLIDGAENTDGGRQLGAFYTKNRVLDNDRFRVKV